MCFWNKNKYELTTDTAIFKGTAGFLGVNKIRQRVRVRISIRVQGRVRVRVGVGV
jgi:hypothetical protein